MNALLDIPTALTEPEGVALQQLAQGKTVLEFGALLGFSTVLLAQVASHVISFDPHTGYPTDNPRDTWAEFNQNLLRHGVAAKVSAYRHDHKYLSTAMQDEGNDPIDLAFIDCDGEYLTTIQVIEAAAQWLSPDGLIAVHDYDLPEWPGAGEAVRDYCTQTGSRFGVIDTLAIIRPAHPDD
jgi:predicted O-methyltransferase YrrM